MQRTSTGTFEPPVVRLPVTAVAAAEKVAVLRPVSAGEAVSETVVGATTAGAAGRRRRGEAGGTGAVTVQAYVAVGPVLPAASVWVTAKVWPPSPSPVSRNGLPHWLAAAPSTEHIAGRRLR